MMRTWQTTLAICLLAVAVMTPALAGGIAAATPSRPEAGSVSGASANGIAGTDIEADGVLMRAALRPNGDAAWEIEYRVQLGENRTEAFESLQRDIRRNTSRYTTQFASRIRGTVGDAENFTDRRMAVENVTVTAETQSLAQEYGVVTYSFTWRGFAVANATTVEAGDALSGLFLDAETSLIVSWSEDYRLVTASPSSDEPRDHAVKWVGPTDFAVDQPRVVVSTAGDAGWSPALLATAVGVVAAAVAAAAWTFRRRRDDPGPSAAAAETETGTTSDADGADAAESADDASDLEPPSELLSNEERVVAILEQRGRMKQQEVAERLDWTDAKTSQVVRDLRDDGTVEGFRLGRENVLRLPDADGGGDGDDPDAPGEETEGDA